MNGSVHQVIGRINYSQVITDEIGMAKYTGPQGPWEPWFAVKPVRDIHGQWHWLKRIYRREINRMVWPSQGYEFGTIFDVVKQ